MKDEIEIIDYTPAHQSLFKSLNLEWLDAYHLTESHDLMVLDDPQKTILDEGGAIYLAKCNDFIVGSAALMKEHEGVYELAKMAVRKEFQGKGISKMLIEKCLAQAVQLSAKKLTLFSNHQLQTALHLYEKYGFRHVEVKNSPFETADVKMELIL
ncbi:MAG: GNAT family N-acetyltransferase [Flavisolibacter sp.]